MVYSLQKFHHYLLGGTFKFFMDHSALKYLVNMPVLEGRIYRWLLLFQELTFEVIVKPGRLNVGPNHLSRLKNGENGGSLDDQLPDTDLFRVEDIPDYLDQIAIYLAIGQCPTKYKSTKRRHLVIKVVECQLIVEQLYKMGLDQVLQRCVMDHEGRIYYGNFIAKFQGIILAQSPLQEIYYKKGYGGPYYKRTVKHL